MKETNFAVSIDKLRVCLNASTAIYMYLKENYTRYNDEGYRVLAEDDFILTFFEEEESVMRATVDVRDVGEYYRLGTFTFHNSAKYEGRAFFSFENAALYRIYMRQFNGEPINHICDLQYICDFYGMTFNNITELELAMDSNYNYIGKMRRMIKNIDRYDLILNGRKVVNDETLDGYGEYYSRSRTKLSKFPTLYFSQAKDTDMKMRIYDKATELSNNSPHKMEYLKKWLGRDDISTLFRVEVVMHNTNVREFVARYGEILVGDYGEHCNILNLLGLSEFRLAMLLDSVDRMAYFYDRLTGERVSFIEMATGI